MRVLRSVRPTREQLKIIRNYAPGFFLVRGAAGSGKTTTAVLRLRFVGGVWRRQRSRSEAGPTRVLVLTYNRTLRGYVEELVSEQLKDWDDVELELSTFGSWAWERLGRPDMIASADYRSVITRLGGGLGFPDSFLLDEVEYVLGRFLPDDRHLYATPGQPLYERRGRGIAPRVERPMRSRLLDEVIAPYDGWKGQRGVIDWNDLARWASSARNAPGGRRDECLKLPIARPSRNIACTRHGCKLPCTRRESCSRPTRSGRPT